VKEIGVKRLATLACLTALILAAPAGAIVGGEPDGNGHPNVGMLVGYDEIGPYYHCSGTLVAPSVFLTAAHCLPGDPEVGDPLEIRISFLSEFPIGENEFGPFPIVDPFVTGSSVAHPAHDGDAPFDEVYVSNDIGVVLLDQAASEVFPGIMPAPLPPLAYLEAGGRRQADRDFTLVGYGIQGQIRPQKPNFFVDFTRRRADMKEKAYLPPSMIALRGVPNAGPATGKGVGCSGDSGGAVFQGALVVAVNSGGDFCDHHTFAGRLDTGSARSFLSAFVSLP
jgi:Trypsin